MKFFDINIGTILIRFYLTAAIVLVAGFIGVWPIAFLAIPIFLSNMLGISFSKTNKKESVGRELQLGSEVVRNRAA